MHIKKFLRRFFSAFLSIAMLVLFSTVSAAESTAELSRFTDVMPGQWYYSAIEYVVTNGYFKGTNENTFAPGEPMTRAMFVTVLGRLALVDPSAEPTSDFRDVPAGSYYGGYVSWAAENDIVRGLTPGFFGPNVCITREQIATFLYRYARHIGLDTTVDSIATPSTFNSDTDISSWALRPMVWAVSKGIMQGTPNGLEPQAQATRAQVAQMIYNFSKLTEN